MTATSTSANRKILLAAFILLLPLASASHYYANQASGSISDETQFSVPEYDSHQEIIAELVAPFIFITILIQLAFTNVLHWIFYEEDDNYPRNIPYGISVREDRLDVRKYSTVMAVTVTAMLVPSPFWDYVILATQLTGLIPLFVLLALVILGAYWILS